MSCREAPCRKSFVYFVSLLVGQRGVFFSFLLSLPTKKSPFVLTSSNNRLLSLRRTCRERLSSSHQASPTCPRATLSMSLQMTSFRHAITKIFNSGQKAQKVCQRQIHSVPTGWHTVYLRLAHSKITALKFGRLGNFTYICSR